MYQGGCSTRDISRTLRNFFEMNYYPPSVSKIVSVVEERFIWEEMPGSVEGSLKSFYNEGIEDNTDEVFLSKEEKEIEVAATRGFFGNKYRVLRA